MVCSKTENVHFIEVSHWIFVSLSTVMESKALAAQVCVGRKCESFYRCVFKICTYMEIVEMLVTQSCPTL